MKDKLNIPDFIIDKYNKESKINELNDNMIKQTKNLNTFYYKAYINVLEGLLL